MSRKCDRCGQKFELLYNPETFKIKSCSRFHKRLCDDCLGFFQLLDEKIMWIKKLKELEKEREYYNEMLESLEKRMNEIEIKQKKFFRLKKNKGKKCQ